MPHPLFSFYKSSRKNGLRTTLRAGTARLSRRWLVGGAVVLAVVSIWAALRPGEPEPVVLRTATVAVGEVRTTLDATGIIKPEVGAMVKTGSRFSGSIRRLYVKVGDPVREAQIIAEIDDREQQAQLAEAKAGLQKARAELTRIATSYPLQIDEARAQAEAAQAEASYAGTMRRRRKTLVDQDLEARSVLDEAVQNSRTSSAALRAREATLRRLEREFPAVRQQAEDAVAAAEATLETARIRLSYAVIRSPIAGVVSQVTAQEGEMVVAGFQVVNLITILDPTRLEMWIYVDETDVGQVRPGLDVEFRVDSLPDRVFRGVVNQIYPQPEIRDNIVYYQTLVRLNADDARQLRPEMTTQCRIVVRRTPGALTVPNDAVKWVDGQKVVFVVDGSRVRRTTPRLGDVGADRTQVLSDLREGDTVATGIRLSGPPKPNALR